MTTNNLLLSRNKTVEETDEEWDEEDDIDPETDVDDTQEEDAEDEEIDNNIYRRYHVDKKRVPGIKRKNRQLCTYKAIPSCVMDALLEISGEEKDAATLLILYSYFVLSMKVDEIRDRFIIKEDSGPHKIASREFVRKRINYLVDLINQKIQKNEGNMKYIAPINIETYSSNSSCLSQPKDAVKAPTIPQQKNTIITVADKYLKRISSEEKINNLASMLLLDEDVLSVIIEEEDDDIVDVIDEDIESIYDEDKEEEIEEEDE